MDLHGHVPSAFERQRVQAPGLLRNGPFHGPAPAVHHPLEPLPRPELLENKIAAQAAEMERLVRENQRLAASNVTLREQLLATQQGLQRVQVHIGSFQTESDIQVKGLLEKIGKLEADIRAGEMVKNELQQAHLELQSLIVARQELIIKIQHTTEELQKASPDIKKLPEMHAELDGLRQEHQKLRGAFEYEKGANMEQVEKMLAMDKNLISMAREVEKLQAEVLNAEKRAHAPDSYGGRYGSPHPVNPSAGQGSVYPECGYRQGGGYADTVYSHGGGYPNAGIGHGGPANYSGAYGRTQAPITGGAAGELYDAYGGVSGDGNSDGYRSMQIPMTGGMVARVGTNSSDRVTAIGYDAARGGMTSTQR
ncbi:protein FLX-like 4 [Phoenix dactylifera]|uniref:Protein FLX-like 4 n=1 Tax=Phoenix dactylifera TaxID=42345 RepID=A0A8B7CQR6_PHODC|nr:protein FLX-like 4 [Phoenix dactylifera]